MSSAATAGPGPGYRDHPEHIIEFEPSPKRVRVTFAGEDIVDTTNALILYESRHVPVYYFPRADVAMERLVATDNSTHCPFKGDANYFSVVVDGQTAENAVWSYEHPFDEVSGLKDYVALYWNCVDHWYEEDEEVFVHARSPRVRVDILDSSRPVRVELGGETVAETNRARFLFETNLPTRYYIPREDVSAELLASETSTQCPYKGTASYHSVKVGDAVHEDIVWYYTDPVHESAKIKDYLCFFNEKVDAVYIDGVAEEKPKTKWS
ncbi:MAG: DUF427 domain-containing protein [Alphaproteobacteria bacterium]|nr:DUF427 domain-containing protein [Alphaproteobacteria bacterium]